jgi:hypothetical protein
VGATAFRVATAALFSAVHHVRGAAAYTILVEAAQNLRLTIGECASFIVNAKP